MLAGELHAVFCLVAYGPGFCITVSRYNECIEVSCFSYVFTVHCEPLVKNNSSKSVPFIRFMVFHESKSVVKLRVPTVVILDVNIRDAVAIHNVSIVCGYLLAQDVFGHRCLHYLVSPQHLFGHVFLHKVFHTIIDVAVGKDKQ